MRETERERGRDRDTETQTDRQTDRQGKTDRQREREVKSATRQRSSEIVVNPVLSQSQSESWQGGNGVLEIDFLDPKIDIFISTTVGRFVHFFLI